MIDYVRCYWKDKNEVERYLRDNKYWLEPYSFTNISTGEMSDSTWTNIENFFVKYSSKSAFLEGSMHKFYNLVNERSNQNYSDYSLSQIIDSVDYLRGSFPPINSASVTQLEFGFNLITQTKPEKIIEDNVFMFKYKPPNYTDDYGVGGCLKQFKKYNYWLKVYDKSKQFGLNENILRIEIKYKRRPGFKFSNINSIEDLYNPTYLNLLYDDLKNRVGQLTVIDNYLDQSIESKDLISLNKYENSNYWRKLKENKSTQSVKNEREKFQALLNKYDLNKTKTEILELMDDKFNKLISTC